MDTLPIIFARTRTPGALIIRTVTWSSWSHCALVDFRTASVIESIAFHGVVETPLGTLMERSSEYVIQNITVPDPEAALAYARGQIGKSYDYTGVLGIGFNREWDSPDKWWCSELVEAAIAAAGRRRFRNPRRITPQDVFNVL